MTHWKKLTNPDYLGAYSLDGGQDIVLTIDHVTRETVTGPEGKKEDCSVIHWIPEENAKPMILNITNAKMIERLLKSPYLEDWSGKRIQIGAEKVKAFGEVVDALRVRPFLPVEKRISCEACGAAIVGGYGMSAEEIAAYTRDKYKRQLCTACAEKEKARK